MTSNEKIFEHIKHSLSFYHDIVVDSELRKLPHANGFVGELYSLEAYSRINKNLQYKLIAKIMKIRPNDRSEMQENFVKIHNSECDAYKLLKESSYLASGKLETYVLIKFQDENDKFAYIIMENVENSVPICVCDTLNKEEIELVLENLALFHATPCEDPHFSEELFSSNVIKMFRDDLVSITVQHLRKITKSEESSNIYLMATKILVELLKPDEMKKFNDKYGRVFCHGDTWQSNILFVDDNGTKKFRNFIDFQTTHMGNPAIDLARLFAGCLSLNNRHRYSEYFIEFYYQKLCAIMKPSFSLEQLKEAYEKLFALQAYLQLTNDVFLGEKEMQNKSEEIRQEFLTRTNGLISELKKII